MQLKNADIQWKFLIFDFVYKFVKVLCVCVCVCVYIYIYTHTRIYTYMHKVCFLFDSIKTILSDMIHVDFFKSWYLDY